MKREGPGQGEEVVGVGRVVGCRDEMGLRFAGVSA